MEAMSCDFINSHYDLWEKLLFSARSATVIMNKALKTLSLTRFFISGQRLSENEFSR